MKHPSGINQAIVDKVFARRGRLHAFEHIDPKKTALVVVDLDIGTVQRLRKDSDATSLIEYVNDLATALRGKGGIVAWVTTPIGQATDVFRAIMGDRLTQMYEQEASAGESHKVADALEVHEGDVHATKRNASAFFPGNANLHEQLQARGIDTVLIVGAVTNVCCESSARDAYELGYKVIMVSDAMWGHKHGLHEGTLAVVFRNFGDVRPYTEVVSLLS